MGDQVGFNTYVRSFPGYRSDAINYNAIPTLHDYEIDAAIIHMLVQIICVITNEIKTRNR